MAALRWSAFPDTVSPNVRGALWGVVAVSIWGMYLAFARANVGAGVSPVDLAFVRYAVAGAIMLPWLIRHSPSTMAGIGGRRSMLLTGLAGPLFILVGASGFLFAPLSHGAVVQPAAITVAGLVLGALVLRDRLTRTRLLGAAVIIVGLTLVAEPAAGGGLRALQGDALFALAGGMWAAFAVLSKRWRVSPLAATAVVSVLSALIFTPIYLTTRGLGPLLDQAPAVLVQQIVVQGMLSGVVAVFAFGRAVELLGAARAAAFPALVPVVAILVGIPVAREVPATFHVVGLLIVTFGLVVIVREAGHRLRLEGKLAAPLGEVSKCPVR